MNKYLLTIFFSMLPISEVRGGIPFAMSQGIAFPLSFFLPMISNMIIVPPLLFMVEPLFRFLRRHHVFEKLISAYEKRASEKIEKHLKFKKWALFIFVGIPLPTTGVYTAVVASILAGVKAREAMLPLIFGVLVSASLTYMAAHGLLGVFNLIFTKF
ncbi:MAG: small multi-drug export protein [Tissierellia bacterium]|nr:small multi-drug export protein [Tissierellia bacterium]